MNVARDRDSGDRTLPEHVTPETSPGRRKVLVVTSNFPRWLGDSTTPFILHLAQDLQALGWNIRVLAPHAPGARTSEVLDGVRVDRFRYLWPESLQTVCYQGGTLINLRRHKGNLAKLPALIFSEWAGVVRRVARGRADLVHSHWLLPQGLVSALAAKPLGVPHIATIHGGDIFALSGSVMTACKRLALSLADAVTVNSSATSEAVRRIAPDINKMVRIPIGASTGGPAEASFSAELRARYRRGEGPLVVFVGRLVAEKGVNDLLTTVSMLRHTLPDITALIVGDGQDRHQLQRMAADLGVSDRAAFVGWIQPAQIPSYIRAADMFVGPSKQAPGGWVEAQGLSIAEAMLAGTPVIATASGGIGDLVLHEQTGLLVREASPEDIGLAVRRLATDPALVDRLRKNALAHARCDYTRDASARAFSVLFDRTLSPRPAKRPDE